MRLLSIFCFALAIAAGSTRAQLRKDKVYIDDGTGNFTVLRSATITGGGNQSIYFPYAGLGGGTIILSTSPSGQTIAGGLRINGGLSLGTMLAPQYGGIGLDASTALNGQLLIGNGSGLELSGITGHANQIIVTNGPGSITLTTPQDIGTSSSPTFGGITVNGTTAINTGGGAATSIGTSTGNVTIGNTTNTVITTTQLKGTTGVAGGGTNNNYAGTIALVAGIYNYTVLNTNVKNTAGNISAIILTYDDPAGGDIVTPYISAKTDATSFRVTLSGSPATGSTVNYLIVNP